MARKKDGAFHEAQQEQLLTPDEMTDYATYSHLSYVECIRHYARIYHTIFEPIEKGYSHALVAPAKAIEIRRKMVAGDLFYLMYWGLSRKDILHPWLFARCREVQDAPDGHIDLWARGHYKSSVITMGMTIQTILNQPEATIGIFSFTKDISKDFVKQIKREFESNQRLKMLFPDVLYSDPNRQSPTWTEQQVTVKRQGNPKEATIEGWGMVDAMPTGRHYTHRIYDDIITQRSVTTPEMINKVTYAWELSLNLGDGQIGGKQYNIERYVGTRYHAQDTYQEILDRKAAIARLHPATHGGVMDFAKGVYLDADKLQAKYSAMGMYTFSCQMLQNPTADKVQGFVLDWWRTYDVSGYPDHLNVCIVVDSASRKGATNDYTAMWVLGIGPDYKWRILDKIRDRLSLTERWQRLKDLHVRWKPSWVFYEDYAAGADIEHYKHMMEIEGYDFSSALVTLPCTLTQNPQTKQRLQTPVASTRLDKRNRILRLVPLHEQGRILYPTQILKKNYRNEMEDVLKTYREQEYMAFPVVKHDDSLDALSNIEDPVVKLLMQPPFEKPQESESERLQRLLNGHDGNNTKINKLRARPQC